MVNVICGPFSPGLEESLIETIRTLKRDDPFAPVAVVTLSRHLLRHLEITLGASLPQNAAALNLTFTTLTKMAQTLTHEAADLPAPINDPMFMGHFLYNAVRAKKDDLPILSRSISSPRLARSLTQTMRDLKDAGVEPETALRALEEKFLGEDDGDKTRDILTLYRAMLQLERHYKIADRSDLFARAATALSRSGWVKQFRAMLVYGFYDLTGVQIDLFQALCRTCETTLFFPCVKDDPDYAFSRAFLDQYLGSADKITWLEDKRLRPDVKRVQVIHASGAADEVWAAAKEIMRLTAEDGYRFQDIGVVARSLDRYRDSLPAIFEDHDIPYTMISTVPIGSLPPIHTLNQFLSLARDGFPRSTVMDLLASPYCNRPPEVRPDLMDVMTRALGIAGGRDGWFQRLERWTRADFTPFPAHGEDEGHPALAVPAEQTAAFVSWLQEIVRDFDAMPASADFATFGRALHALVRKYVRLSDDVWEPVEDLLLHSLPRYDLFGSETMRTDVIDLALEYLATLTVRKDAPPDRGVTVLDAMSARGIPFKVILILGLNEKIFPRFILEDPHLRDSTRSRLSFTLGNKILEKLKGYHEERLLFRMLIDNAIERTVLIHQRSDEEGKVQIPSIYLRSFPHPRLSVPKGIAAKIDSVPAAHRTPAETAVAMSLQGGDLREFLKSEGRDAERYAGQMDMLQAIEQPAQPLTPYDGLVDPLPEVIRQIEERGMSPTQLETLAKCPFQFYGHRLLRLEEVKEPEEQHDIPAHEKGTLIHAILEKAYQGLASQGGFTKPMASSRIRDFLERIAEPLFAEYESRGTLPFPLLWDARKAEFLRQVKNFMEVDLAAIRGEGFVPTYFEAAIDGTVSFGKVTLACHGTLDRIDVRQTGKTVEVRVTDYKTGKRPDGKLDKQIATGKKLQLPLYLLMARSFVERERHAPTVAIHDARYAYVLEEEEDDMVQTMTAGMLDAARDRIAEVISGLHGVIRLGTFFIYPDDYGHCRWCSLSEVCRKNHAPTLWRTQRSKPYLIYEQLLAAPVSEKKSSKEKPPHARRSKRPR